MKLKKNHTITIYDDQISDKRSGGKKMRLIKRIIKHPDKEYWHVRFVGENLSGYRWIPTASKEEETGLDS
jgi:hypothetical protein